MLNRSVIGWPHGVSVHKPEKCYNGFTLVQGRGDWDPVSEEVVWEYIFRPHAAKYLSIVTGGAQRLPNGNTLSLDTDKGRVFEITPQGEIVWEYINPRGGFYRTQRIGIFRVIEVFSSSVVAHAHEVPVDFPKEKYTLAISSHEMAVGCQVISTITTVLRYPGDSSLRASTICAARALCSGSSFVI